MYKRFGPVWIRRSTCPLSSLLLKQYPAVRHHISPTVCELFKDGKDIWSSPVSWGQASSPPFSRPSAGRSSFWPWSPLPALSGSWQCCRSKINTVSNNFQYQQRVQNTHISMHTHTHTHTHTQLIQLSFILCLQHTENY